MFHLDYSKLKKLSIQIFDKNKQENILKEIQDVYWAQDFSSRLIGLMNMPENKINGLLIDNCNSIHTFFMKFPLDCLFLNKKGEIVQIAYKVKPYRMTKVYWKASKTLEIKENLIPKNLNLQTTGIRIQCLN